jgi:hypothetical protein
MKGLSWAVMEYAAAARSLEAAIQHVEARKDTAAMGYAEVARWLDDATECAEAP